MFFILFVMCYRSTYMKNMSFIPDKDPRETDFYLSLYPHDGTIELSPVEQYDAAQNSLLETVHETMQGKGESVEEMKFYIESLVEYTAEGYSRIVQSYDDTDDKFERAADVLVASIKGLVEATEIYNVPENIVLFDKADMIEEMESENAESDEDEQMTNLRNVYITVCGHVLTAILGYAQENINMIKSERREKHKQIALNTALDTTKIAIGTTAALLAMRFIDKKRR